MAYYVNHTPVKIITRTSNLFNAKKIVNTNIKVNENGSQIIMPLATSGNGLSFTKTLFKDLCPEVRVGDVIYFDYNRTYVDREDADDNYNKFIYFVDVPLVWNFANGALTIEERHLNSHVGIYGNRFMGGETKQVILKNFRIVRELSTPFEPYNQLLRVRSGVLIRNPKNLIPFPYRTSAVSLGGLSSSDNEDGSITIIGKRNVGGVPFERVLTTSSFQLEIGKTYTYTLYATNYPNIFRGAVQVYKIGVGWVKNIGYSENGKPFTFTFTDDVLSDGQYIRFNVYGDFSTKVEINTTAYPILNEGSTAEPYFIYD